MIKYSENGLWIERLAQRYRIGLSSKGQDELGNVGFVELFKSTALVKNESFMSVEAAKAVTELISPLSGTVVSWHEELENEPELLNEHDPEKNWIVVLENVAEEDAQQLFSSDSSSLGDSKGGV